MHRKERFQYRELCGFSVTCSKLVRKSTTAYSCYSASDDRNWVVLRLISICLFFYSCRFPVQCLTKAQPCMFFQPVTFCWIANKGRFYVAAPQKWTSSNSPLSNVAISFTTHSAVSSYSTIYTPWPRICADFCAFCFSASQIHRSCHPWLYPSVAKPTLLLSLLCVRLHCISVCVCV